MRKALREMKNVVYQFSPIELKVREATNNDRFMVSSGQLAEIARATNDYTEYPALFSMLWKRLTDLEHVMHVQKALHLAEYLLRHGAERFVSDARRRARDIAALQKYKHYDEQNQDDAKEARARAKAVYALLMDDQLLAQERGKSARLASEGRLAGMGTYDDDVPAAAAPRYAAAAQGRRYNEDVYGDEDAPAAAAPQRRAPPAAAAVPKSAVLRRRSVDEDPFSNPVIPAAVSGAPVKPRERTAPAAAAASSSKRSAAPAAAAPAPLDVEEPDDEEDEEAAAKRAKKEKKKKKKEEEARRAAAAAEEAARQQSKQAARSNGASSSSAAAAASGNSLANFDLVSFAPDTVKGSGDIDILTGMQMSGGIASGPNGHAGESALEDLFASATLTEEQVSSPLFYQQGGANGSGNPFQSPSPQAGGSVEGSVSPIVSPTAQLVNLNNLMSTAPRAEQKGASVDAGVSMSMMRSIQPLGAPAQAPSNSGVDPMQKRRSNIPSSIPLDYAQQQPNAFMYPHLGPQMAGPQQMQGYPPQQMQGPMGYPQQQQPMMMQQQQQGYGGYPQPQAYAPMGVGYPQQQQQHPGMQLWNGGGMGAPQPMMALMPPPSMAVYGGAPASSASDATFTSMRQAPNKINHQAGAINFEVPRAQARAVEPVNYMQSQQQPGGQQFYGQRNGAQQQQQQQFSF